MLTIDAIPDAWPKRMDTATAARYLREEHGLPTDPKTLVNHRALRKGPTVRYFGAKPLYDRTELDRWANDEALQPISPLTRNARLRTESQATRAKAGGVVATPAAAPVPFPSRSPSTAVAQNQKQT
jgi:hypothetical protein